MPSMLTSARMKMTGDERDRAVERAVCLLASELQLSDVERSAAVLVLSRGLLTDDERQKRDIYHAAASKYVLDGDLEVDSDAVVSFSDEAGAYVQGWKWVSNDDVKDVLPSGELFLETSDDRTGSEVYVLHDGKVVGLGMDWDRDGDGETVQASFMIDGAEAFTIDGDDWREIESSGQVEKLVGKAMTMNLAKGKPIKRAYKTARG